MSGHTPGPWKVTYGEFTEKGVKYEIDMPDQRLTAFDARLIAAAPDLKEALEELVAAQDANDEGWFDSPKMRDVAMQKARTALAKCAPEKKP